MYQIQTDIETKKSFVGTTHGTCASEERPGGSECEERARACGGKEIKDRSKEKERKNRSEAPPVGDHARVRRMQAFLHNGAAMAAGLTVGRRSLKSNACCE